MNNWIKTVSLIILICTSHDSEGKEMIAPIDRYHIADWQHFHDHQGFYPYLCEFGYRTLADHVIDPTHREFDPKQVQLGDILYVAVWYLDWFVDQVHDKIQNPYILVTCDVGSWIPSPSHLKLAYDPKVACWFAKNMLFSHHSKLFQLPMGQFYYLWADGITSTISSLNQLIDSPPLKDILLYLNHTERPHGRRILVAEKFYNQPYCFSRNIPRRNVNFEQFWEEVARSHFVLSPLGLEVDCTRTWECFALGTIPVVEHSYLDPLYDQLPILLIHSWDEINEEFLHRKLDEIRSQPSNPEKAYFDYWKRFILEKQAQIRRGDLDPTTLEANNFSDHDLMQISKLLSQYHKPKKPLIYRGNLTCLRAFQLANTIPSISKIYLSDIWLKISYLRQYSSSTSLLRTNRVQVCPPQELALYYSNREVTYFLDLTHFKHALLSSVDELADFEHSLEKDIHKVYHSLHPGSLLIGNEANDHYVAAVIERLREKIGARIYRQDHFWYCIKQ